MSASVDPCALCVREGERAIPFALELATGDAILEFPDAACGVRLLSWGEKCNLARFAKFGPDFVERQWLLNSAPNAGRGDAEVVLALTLWLHSPEGDPLALQSKLLSQVTMALCAELKMSVAELAAMPVPHVEALWSALENRVNVDDQAASGAIQSMPLGPDTTRIVVEPDPEPTGIHPSQQPRAPMDVSKCEARADAGAHAGGSESSRPIESDLLASEQAAPPAAAMENTASQSADRRSSPMHGLVDPQVHGARDQSIEQKISQRQVEPVFRLLDTGSLQADRSRLAETPAPPVSPGRIVRKSNDLTLEPGDQLSTSELEATGVYGEVSSQNGNLPKTETQKGPKPADPLIAPSKAQYSLPRAELAGVSRSSLTDPSVQVDPERSSARHKKVPDSSDIAPTVGMDPRIDHLVSRLEQSAPLDQSQETLPAAPSIEDVSAQLASDLSDAAFSLGIEMGG